MSRSNKIEKEGRYSTPGKVAIMAVWRYTIRLSDLWGSNAPFPVLRNQIVERIEATEWARESVEVQEALKDLKNTRTSWGFDESFRTIYDLADQDRVWIATF